MASQYFARLMIISFAIVCTLANPLTKRLNNVQANELTFGPTYNAQQWPKTLTVASDPLQRGACTQFPEILIAETRFWNAPNNTIEVFCWQNHTTRGHDDFLRLVEGCYIDSSYLVPSEYETPFENSLPANFKEVLPWCGPIRPFEIFGGRVENIVEWEDESGEMEAGMKCFLSPSLKSEFAMKDWEWTVTHCWVLGHEVNGNSTWYQKLEANRNSEKCYVPAVWLNDKVGSMEGAGGPCPLWEWPI